jgi:hypothetical protein
VLVSAVRARGARKVLRLRASTLALSALLTT